MVILLRTNYIHRAQQFIVDLILVKILERIMCTTYYKSIREERVM